MSGKIKSLFVRILAWIGGLTVVYVTLTVVAVVWLIQGANEHIPDAVVLEWELRSLPQEVNAPSLESLAGTSSLNLVQTVAALDRALTDERVQALWLKVRMADEGLVGLAAAQELRDALWRWREAGKPVIVWTDTFSDMFHGNLAYYLATAGEEIHLQPSGDVALTGLVWEQPFLKEALESIGVTFEAFKRHEYKTALDSLSESGFTEANREAVLSLLHSQTEQILEGVSQGRKLTAEQAKALLDMGIFSASEALAKGLVDGLNYHDEVRAMISERWSEANLLYLERYHERVDNLWSKPKGDDPATVALVYGVGNVVRGPGDSSLFSDLELSSEAVSAALRAAVADDDVAAILLRIDSPGGSYVASDTVWREVVKAREAGKPVVASMGRLAASGGYFVAVPANHVIAQPGTLTGSIGVIAGMPDTRDFWDRLKIRWESEQVGANAALLSGVAPWTPEQRGRFEGWLDTVYGDFVAKAAKGRGMTREDLHAVAKGRVWTGREALARGLIDETGGYVEALAACRRLANIATDRPLRLKVYPKKADPFSQLFAKPESSEDAGGASPFSVSLGLPKEWSVLWRLWQQSQGEALLQAPLPGR